MSALGGLSGKMPGRVPNQDSKVAVLLIAGITLVGLASFGYAVFQLLGSAIDLQWVWLALVTLLIVSRLDIHIPRTCGTITLSDTFVFISLALFGVAPTVVLAGVDGAVTALHHRERRRMAPFSLGLMSLAVFVSATIASRALGDISHASARIPIPSLAITLGFVAVLYHVLSAGIVGAIDALRNSEHRMRVWSQHLMWSSISCFVGAAAACLVVKLISIVSFDGFLLATPILACTYLTYRSHQDKVEASVDQAEQVADQHVRTIEALAAAMEAKGEINYDHVRRVQIYATGMARLFGLSEPEIEALKAATLLHDVGKLAVPDHILHKPGPLTPAEFETMKTHTIAGSEILDKVGFPYPVVPVVRHHHERWDGLGYPDGLRGDQIPIGARILSVADSFDSLMEDRKYRKAKTRAEAISILKESAGNMFDPEVVSVFLEHLQEFETEVRWQRVDIQHSGRRREIKHADAGTIGKTAVDRVRSAHRDVVSLYNVAETIASHLDLRDTFAVFSSRLQDIVPYTTCVLYLLQPDGSDVEIAHASGRNFDSLKGKKIPARDGIVGWVIANQQPICNCDPRLDFDAWKLETTDKYQTATVVPLLKDLRVLGALGLYSADLPAYQPEDLPLVEAVAKLASDAIANALNHEITQAGSLVDSTTGLPNARALRHRFEEEADRALRHRDRFAILMMDLDGFKTINDQLGHEVGDAVLRELGRVFSSQARSSDFVARYAGDEFVAILQAGPEEAVDLAQWFQKIIERKDFGPPGTSVRLSMTAGCSLFGPDGTSLDELLITADRAMHAEKARRKALSGPGSTGRLTGNQYRVM